MTTKEKEICDASLLYFKKVQTPNDNPLVVCGHFIAGAKWANKNRLSEICSWLDHNTTISTETIARLRKAMEE